MRHSILFAVGVLLILPPRGYGEEFEFRPPEEQEPLNDALVEYVTLQVDGQNTGTMVCGKSYKISGEFELGEDIAPLQFLVVEMLVHHEQAPQGLIIQTALAAMTHIEGSRYAFTSDTALADFKWGGEAELRIITGIPGKDGTNPIYRRTITLLESPEFEFE